jgi:hypothetical protein
LIARRFPTVGLYDQVAAPADLDVVLAIEALTNPRVQQELGPLSLVPPADRVAGPCATLIMAVFKPKALSKATAAGHFGLHWDGKAISHWFEKGAPHAV